MRKGQGGDHRATVLGLEHAGARGDPATSHRRDLALPTIVQLELHPDHGLDVACYRVEYDPEPKDATGAPGGRA